MSLFGKSSVSFVGILVIILGSGCKKNDNAVGKPAESKVVPKVVIDASKSKVISSHASLVADGSTTATVTVTLLDGAGKPISGKAVTLTTGLTNTTVTAISSTTNVKGEATFSAKSTTVGEAAFTATVSTDGNLSIKQIAKIDFCDLQGFNVNGVHKDTQGLFNSLGYNRAGYDNAGFNAAGYNAAGFNAAGFNAAGIHQATGHLLNPAGYNALGFNAAGFNAAGIHQATGNIFNLTGHNVLGQNRAAILGAYANSEAQALRIGYRIRSGNPAPSPQWLFNGGTRWVGQVVINGQEFDSSVYPHDLEVPYYIDDHALAGRVATELGVPFVFGDALATYEVNFFLSNALRDDIRDNIVGMGGADTVRIVGGLGNQRVFPRMFTVNPMPPNQEAYKTYLLAQVELRRLALGLPNLSPVFADYANVNPTALVAKPEAIYFRDLLEAIENNNEVAFINNLALFSNVWGANNAGSRSPFFDSFATLYVAKRFPSRAMKGIYFHFTLNCGQIYS